MRAADILDQLLDLAILRVDESPLKNSRQESGLPVFGVLDWHPAGAHGYEAGEILVLGPQTIKHPRADARTRLDAVAAIHQHERRFMVGHLRIHRANHRNIVRMRAVLANS